jgi:hypothetical protein
MVVVGDGLVGLAAKMDGAAGCGIGVARSAHLYLFPSPSHGTIFRFLSQYISLSLQGTPGR